MSKLHDIVRNVGVLAKKFEEIPLLTIVRHRATLTGAQRGLGYYSSRGAA